ncbi:MAG TPA: TonB-dependent receptor [Candidatus Dormibacteraeota bacterium]|nr:TonB-dependent receptor [Candidatus Dormibacteraeota bacterium]
MLKSAFCLGTAIIAVLILLLSPLLISAQTVSGSMSGHVVDSSGAVVPGVSVMAKSDETSAVREALTNSDGYYLIPFVPIGTYEVTAQRQGFATITRSNVSVTLNKTTSVDFSLTLPGLQQTVTVSEVAPLIDVAGGQIRRSMDDSFIGVLPSAARNFLGIAALFPGFQTNPTSGQNNFLLSSGSSVSFNGTGTRGTTFLTDGVTNDDGSENQNRQGVNLSTIKEMQIVTNNFAPEFGRGFGAVVLVQTKSGSNQMHGEAYWYLRNSALDARSFFANPRIKKAVSQTHRAGGTLGGPIVKDRLFFFGSLERFWQPGSQISSTYLLQSPFRTITVDPAAPDAAARRAWVQGIIDRFPTDLTPNDPVRGPFAYSAPAPRSSHTKDYSVRIDWRKSDKNLFYARYQFSNYFFGLTKEFVRGENIVQDHRFQNVGITHTHIFSSSTTGEFRFGFGRRRITASFLSGEAKAPIVRWSFTNFAPIIGNASSFPQQRYQNDFQYVYNISSQLGSRHTLKGGTDIRRIQLNDRAENYNRGFWQFMSAGRFNAMENFQRGVVTTYTQGFGPAYLGLRTTELNFYGQDDFRLKRDLVFNIGFRVEHVGSPTEVNNLVPPDFGADTYFEPRFGFAYSPNFSSGFLRRLSGGPGHSSIRGGFGIFHGRIYQSIFSQIGASTRFNPPNAAVLSLSNPDMSVADPTNGFVFRPGPPTAQVGLTLPESNLHMPYTEQWNLTVERQLPWNSALQASYIGNRGIGFIFYHWDNRAQFPWTSTQPTTYKGAGNFPGVTFDNIDQDLFNARPAPGFISLSQARTDARRRDGRFSSILRPSNGAWSYYHALQITYTQRPLRGLNVQAGYTWSKNIDTGSEGTFVGGGDTNAAVSETQGGRSLRGLSRLSQPHRFTLSYIYELPLFKKQEGVFGRVLGGWQVSGVTTLASGNPFTVFIGYDLNGDGIGGDRPFLRDPAILGRSVDNGRINPATGRQFSTGQLPITAFSPDASVDATKRWPWFPGSGIVGDLGRNTFFSHGQNNWDFAIIKNVRVYGERHNIQFRAEMFNLFNRVQFDLPSFLSVVDTSVASWRLQPRFGEITSQRNSPRNMQMSLRYAF